MAIKIKKTSPKDSQQNAEETAEQASSSLYQMRGQSPLGNPGDNLPGIESIDRVVMASENIFDWAARHRNALIAAFVVLILGILGVVWLAAQKMTNRDAESQELYQAYMAAIAPVGKDFSDESLLGDNDPHFDTGEARLEAVYERAGLVTKSKSGASQIAQLMRASAGLELGKDVDANVIASFQNNASTPLQKSLAQAAVATQKANAGDLAGALQALDALSDADASLKPFVLEQRAILIETYGDLQDALKAWEAAAEAAVDTPAESGIRKRVQILKLQAGTLGDEQANAVDADHQGNE